MEITFHMFVTETSNNKIMISVKTRLQIISISDLKKQEEINMV